MAIMPLKKWYPASLVKRKLGAIVQALNEKGGRVSFDGSADAPRFFLEDIDDVSLNGSEQHMGIDQVRTFWSEKLDHLRLTGERVVVDGSRKPRAVLYRNEALAKERSRARKGAVSGQMREFRTILDSLGQLAQQLELATKKIEDDAAFYRPILNRLDERLEVVDRRFAELWKERNASTREFRNEPGAL